MPRTDLETPLKVASTFTGLFAAVTIAGLACLAVLLLGAAQGGVGEGALLPFSGGPHGWRREALPWLLFSLTAFAGVVVLGAVALCRARHENAAQQRMMRAARALEVMLEEKDALLAEVHHRVKNNMQAVVSLLQIEATQTGDERMRQRFDALTRRIVLMGQVHERVYAADSFACMDAAAHVAQHSAALAEEWPSAELTCQTESLRCGIDIALPVTLIAHELVANALRHGGAGGIGGKAGQRSRISVSLCRSGREVLLRVSDDGRGPVVGARPGMGLVLVQLLAEQAGALVEARRLDRGYAVEVRLPGALFS